MSSWLRAQQDTSFLKEVVVTANKVANKQTETSKVVSVINREMLRQSGGRSLGELLNQVVGVTIPGANSNLGTNLTVSIRGASAGNTLILLDGIPVNDPSVITNYFDINLLSTDQIERIEVLKGGHSTLYGSDAVAGVINIISRKNEASLQHPHLNASLSGGNYSTLRTSIGFSGRSEKWDYSLQVSQYHSGGFSAATDSTHSANFDRDAFTQQSVRAQLGYTTGKNSRLFTSYLYSKYRTDLDAAAFVDEQDFTAKNSNQQFNIGWNWQRGLTRLNIQYQYSRVARNYLDDSTYRINNYSIFSNSNYQGQSHFADIFFNTNRQHLNILAGIDFRYHATVQDYYSTGLPWGPYTMPTLRANMWQLSGYATLRYHQNNWSAELGGRINRHSIYGNNATFSFNPSVRLNEQIRLFGNGYAAYKTPTLFQLFDTYAGNDKLTPEKGIIGELGIDWTPTTIFQSRLVAFYRNSINTIIYTVDPTSWSGKYLNASRQTNFGIEWEATLILHPVTIRANYAFTDGKTTSEFNGAGEPIGKDSSYFNLYRIPKHAVNWQATYQKNKFTFQIGGRIATSRQEYIYRNAPITMPGYATVDWYTEYQTHKKGLRIFLDIRNITNTKYEEIRGYNVRGFTAVAGILVGR